MAASASGRPTERSRSATTGRNSRDDLPFVFDRFYQSAKARALPGSAWASRSSAGSPTCATEPSKQFRCSKG